MIPLPERQNACVCIVSHSGSRSGAGMLNILWEQIISRATSWMPIFQSPFDDDDKRPYY